MDERHSPTGGAGRDAAARVGQSQGEGVATSYLSNLKQTNLGLRMFTADNDARSKKFRLRYAQKGKRVKK